MSDTTLDTLKKELREKAAEDWYPGKKFSLVSKPHGRKDNNYLTEKMLTTLRWVWMIALEYGEYSPESNTIHVSMFLNPTWLHQQLVAWAEKNEVAVVKLRSFLRLFDKSSPASELVKQIRWKRDVKAKLCGVCVAAALARSKLVREGKGAKSPAWEEIRRKHLQHIHLVGVERRAYMDLAKNVPVSELLMLIIDAAHPLRHPRKLYDTEESRKFYQFISPLIGVINHTFGHSVVFTSPASGIPGREGEASSWDRADVDLSVLADYLRVIYSKGGMRRELHLQMDGGSTLRSFALILFCGVLLLMGWTKRITIASLIPGHSHCDIDALFSIFWRKLHSSAYCDRMTWNEVAPVFFEAYPGLGKEGNKTVRLIDRVFKFRAWFGLCDSCEGEKVGIRSCRSKRLKNLFGSGKEDGQTLKKPHRFVLELDSDGYPVVTSYFSSANDEVFQKAVRIFDSVPNLQALGAYNLSEQYKKDKARVVEGLRKLVNEGRAEYANLEPHHVEEYEQRECAFTDAIEPPLFSAETRDYEKLAQILGRPKLKSDRSRSGPGATKRQRMHEAGDMSDSWHSAVDEDGEEDEIDDDSDDSLSVIAPFQVIERILKQKYDYEHQQTSYLVKFKDADLEVWILGSELGNSEAIKEFEARQEKEKNDRLREAKNAATRELIQQEKEERERKTADKVQCDKCKRFFAKRGLSKHQKTCLSKK